MTRTLPTENVTDDDGGPIKEWLQYRGRETTAVVDRFGIVFTTSHKNAWGTVVHDPLPVVPDDADDPPPDAIPRSVSDALVERNPLVGYGVVCEYPTEAGHRTDLSIDGKVMRSPKSVNGRVGTLTSPPEETGDEPAPEDEEED